MEEVRGEEKRKEKKKSETERSREERKREERCVRTSAQVLAEKTRKYISLETVRAG